MKVVSIIAGTFHGNRGAEAMLSTTIGELKECYGSELELNIYTYYPERDAELINDQQISLHSAAPIYLVLVLTPCALIFRLLEILNFRAPQRILPASVRALARSKALVCLAGVSFVEGRTKFILFNIATILPAMLLGVPVIKFSQAMGSFKSLTNKVAARFFLGRCQQVFTRGETTHSYLQELFGNKPIYQRANDVAFLFRPEFCLSRELVDISKELVELETLKKSGRIIVGICPSVVVAIGAEKAGWDYQARMQELISRITNHGYIVALYPNATRGEDMDKTHNNDLPLIHGIIQGLAPSIQDSVICFSGSLNVAQIFNIIGSCDVHAVSRFHAMIASLALEIPVMVIGWSHKYLEVMEQFEQQDMVLDYKEGKIEPIIKCIEQLILERSHRSIQIGQALPTNQQLSSRQIDYLILFLNHNT
ncbi:MAG: polysaccharide pyruvyl transferase family protein [Candidatus Reddybacter sp.]